VNFQAPGGGRNSSPNFFAISIPHRQDAVYPATIVGIPPMEDFYIGGASVKLFLPIFKMNFPEIVDIALRGAHAPSRVGFDALDETASARRQIRSARALTDAREARALPTPIRSATAFSPKARPTCSTTRRAKSPAAANPALTRQKIAG
jgi:hypothetical protein